MIRCAREALEFAFGCIVILALATTGSAPVFPPPRHRFRERKSSVIAVPGQIRAPQPLKRESSTQPGYYDPGGTEQGTPQARRYPKQTYEHETLLSELKGSGWGRKPSGRQASDWMGGE